MESEGDAIVGEGTFDWIDVLGLEFKNWNTRVLHLLHGRCVCHDVDVEMVLLIILRRRPKRAEGAYLSNQG